MGDITLQFAVYFSTLEIKANIWLISNHPSSMARRDEECISRSKFLL